MLIKTLTVGQLDENCYVVTNEKTLECVVIDPGDESNYILNYIEDNHLKCQAVMITHGHFDHTGAALAVAEETGAAVYMNTRDDCRVTPTEQLRFSLPDGGINYDDGDIIDAAGMRFEILATPGHTPGGVTIRCEDCLFTGDTLFRGSIGRTDLGGGDSGKLYSSLKKLCKLEGDYEIYPGHMGTTTLQRERSFNYYCRAAMSM